MEVLIALAIFVVVTAVVLLAIWRALRKRYPKEPADTLDRIPPEKLPGRDPQWWLRYPLRALIAAAAFFAILGLVDDAGAAEADPNRAVRIELNTGACPPPTEESLPILIFTVHIDPGNGKPQYNCARVMKRKYLITPRVKPTQTSSTKE